MAVLPEITEIDLQPVKHQIRLKLGGFYRAANGSTWCCVHFYDEHYHCLRIPDNTISRFQENGYLQRDDGTAEDTLVERVMPSQQAASDVINIMDRISDQAEVIEKLVTGQCEHIALLEARVKHLSQALEKIAAGGEPVHTAKRALAWLIRHQAELPGGT